MIKRSFVLGCLLAVVAGSPSPAADMPLLKAPPPPPLTANWTGWYVGAQGGFAQNTTAVDVSAATPVASAFAQLGAAPKGGLIGAQVGYDYMVASNIVAGVRADGDLANISSGSNLGTTTIGGLGVTVQNATNYMGTFNARLGYTAASNLLLYTTGGLAWGGARPRFNVFANAAPIALSMAANDTSVGWNVGAGVEAILAQHWSGFVEVDYLDIGQKSLTATLLNGTVLATSANPYKFVLAKAGINYRF